MPFSSQHDTPSIQGCEYICSVPQEMEYVHQQIPLFIHG